MRLDSLVSSPPAVALTTKGPRTSTSPASTVSPSFTEIGIGSPVNGARSMAPVPSMIIPSTGITSPERTSTRSPSSSASTGIKSSFWQFASEIEGFDEIWITFRVLCLLFSGVFWLTRRALLGSLSRPPCIDSRALIRALSSRCEENPTNPTTIRASAHS